MNAGKTRGASDGEGRGFSFDGRALYAFGRGRVRPYVSGGAAFFQHDHKTTYDVPASAFLPNGATYPVNEDVEGVAPVFGGGLRVQVARHLVIRPEVSWFVETAPNSANRTVVPRAGVSIGAAW